MGSFTKIVVSNGYYQLKEIQGAVNDFHLSHLFSS